MTDRKTEDAKAAADREIVRRIDGLMAEPTLERPTITVVGDNSVTSIRLPKRPAKP